MLRASEETDPEVSIALLPLENHNPQPSLEEVLASLHMVLAETVPGRKRHIYCELPWDVVHDPSALEEWIGSRPEFAENGPEDQNNPAAWNLSFVCVCPADADRLPEDYRRGLEEFARATQSAVIVARREGDDSELEWVDTEVLDFGRKVEIFEEDLWPASIENDRAMPDHKLNGKELDQLTLSVSGDRTSYMDLFQDLVHGYYGPIWGAEAYWKNARGQCEALCISQGRLFSWTSDSPSLLRLTPLNGAMLSLCGGPLRRQDLILALRSQSFC
ncbi:MAG: hypothetical protein JST16_13520 [Bdellovibrionales bacterium]|nr:hypothetical protein [Bdellovibrionales bacterium]